MSYTENSGKSAKTIIDVILHSELLLEVLTFLDEKNILLVMEVCRKMKQIAGSCHLWNRIGEVEAQSSRVKWPAFKFQGVLKRKKDSMVVKCQSRVSGKVLVVKRIKKKPATPGEVSDEDEAVADQGFPVRYLREACLLRACNHPNVMKLEFVTYYEGQIELFSEYVGLNVEDYITKLSDEYFRKNNKKHEWVLQVGRYFMKQVFKGIDYCHSIGILLRDVKPRNFLISSNGTLKLTGFVLARFSLLPEEPLTQKVVTLSYRAPEIILGGTYPVYTAPVDIWSAGCTFAEMVTGQTLFEGDSEIGQLLKIFKLLGTPSDCNKSFCFEVPSYIELLPQWKAQSLSEKLEGLCDAGVDLLSRMLLYHPCSRITARDALKHPYFKGNHMCNQSNCSLQCLSSDDGLISLQFPQDCEISRTLAKAALADAKESCKQEDHEHQVVVEAQVGKSCCFEDSANEAAMCSLSYQNIYQSYGVNIFQSLTQNEGKFVPSKQESFQNMEYEVLRRELVHFIIQVIDEDIMKPETLYLAVNYMDRYVTSSSRALHNMKLVAVACILIASKQEELAPQSVLNLIVRTEDTFDEVLGMEADVLRVLDYSLTLCTPWRCSEFYRFHILYDRELPASLKRLQDACFLCFHDFPLQYVPQIPTSAKRHVESVEVCVVVGACLAGLAC
eukprot:759129-Hanusia_phi.AAC.2